MADCGIHGRRIELVATQLRSWGCTRSRAPALERATRRLPPPESDVEAGASEAVCSEAGASEQESFVGFATKDL